MSNESMSSVLIFVMVGSAVLLLFTLLSRRSSSKLDDRLAETFDDSRNGSDRDAMADFAKTALPRMGKALVPTNDDERTKLQTRMIHAGLYGRQAMSIFLGVKLLLIVAPALLGAIAGVVGLIGLQTGLVAGGCMGILGMIGPSFWLDRRKKKRQLQFRRALPDALDVLVICLEGGLSLPGGLRRVGTDLRSAHPLLAFEINIVQREILLGRFPGEALQQMGARTDLEEVRGLASVISQSERFGASLVKSLRIHAEVLRERRKQKAEEMAQKAGTKVLMPTLFFIFPAMFVVILGPAAFQVVQLLVMMSGKS